MKIVCDTTFLDGRDRFEKGDVRTVSDEDGARFIKNKWAHKLGDSPADLPLMDPANLDVQNAKHAQGVTNG